MPNKKLILKNKNIPIKAELNTFKEDTTNTYGNIQVDTFIDKIYALF